MRSVVLALGANLGDSLGTLRQAVQALRSVDGLVLDAISAVYETDPVGGPDQPVYLNAVAVGRTSLEGAELLAELQRIELAFARTREVRWGPRTLDLDVIAIDDVVSDDPRLTLPHPRAHERAFVLVPWLEADADAALVGHGPVRNLVAGLDASGVRRTALTLVPGDQA